MSELGLFTTEEQDLLTGILFRVGHFVSHADDDGSTEKDDMAEQKAIDHALSHVARTASYGSVSNELAAEALRQVRCHGRWKSLEANVVEDVAEATKIAHARLNQDQFNGFRRAVMTVGTSVARAYRENADYEQVDSEAGVFARIADSINSAILSITDNKSYKAMNVSPAEEDALISIHQALRKN